ncbi:hypothetical protein WNY61_00075 [Sulfitobacter sp. AS92]|uniref:hypothetical protein n=1 Tax=Sulfitobacter sp. AS92 TaxID=3135783 RepID=UPI0031781E83
MTLVLVFLIVFLIGPFLFKALIAVPPSRRAIRVVGAVVLAAFLTAIGLRYGLLRFWSDSLWLLGAVALALWSAWIAVIALVVQALRRADPRPAMRRWSGVLGAVGTTVPWFGLVLANLMRST